jgi:hypothetical protein
MNKIILSTLTLIILLFTTGCSPMISKYRVTIDAITVPNLTIIPKNYSIKALDKDTDANSLEFQHHTQILNTLLQKEGYSLANANLLAEQIIHFDYGIEKISEETQTYREPDVTFGFSVGYPYRYYGHQYHPYWSDFGYGSYTTYRKKYTYYNRYITLLGKEVTGKELWRVDVSSIGESTNLKKIVPLLIESAIPYIGKNPKEPIQIVIKEKSVKEE